MPAIASVPAQFIEQAPAYDVRNGHVHIDYGCIKLVVPVDVSAVALARHARALDEWFEGQSAVVIPIKAG